VKNKMSKVKSEVKVKKFLEESQGLLESPSTIDEFLEVFKRENIRQVKDQLATELMPLQNRLQNIERQQTIIIGLLERKVDLDAYEKEIMDLLKKKLESDK